MNATTYGQLVHSEIEYSEIKTEEKVSVKEVTITRAEGPTALCGIKHTFSSLNAAEALIMNWASKMSMDQGGYDKVDFSVTFTDEDSYCGRIDMMPKHRTGYSIKQHMVDTIKYYSTSPYSDEQTKLDCIAALPKYVSL